MIRALLRFVLGCLLLPGLWVTAHAQAVSFPELNTAVPGHADTTYLDLARMIVPDLKADGEGFYAGTTPIEMRHILGDDQGGSPPPTVSLPNAAVLTVNAGGKQRLAMLFDLGQAQDSAEGFAALALYDLDGKPRLLDAVDVATDQSTYFREPAKLRIGPGDDAIITMSMHFNSNQNYVGTVLIVVRKDRFEPIDAIYTFDEKLCAYKRTQDMTFEALAGDPSHAPLKVTVTDTAASSGESCDEAPPEPSSHEVSVTYRWDAARSRYAGDSDAFEKLAAENAKRF
ncbi:MULTISPECIES: hypothetical protein [unclassified Mesorhizobium]|uniref:hypothetical protein n=1 Tax=unclassified Mesorhizobium TaxID=325217 RepID=UPI00086B1273|nr:MULTISPECIES: hypothetical protein [unclassified Mesorhizobium]MBN9255569.1 hypothetical protein [Mesorhizobium sp.]ODT20642.1 MAG: hypothetical protein ABS57_00975 [Mesorhizobium sp. SCN 65-12]OJX83998.1 MAG: hypothetical protein BGO93_27485 [Mesorhizobium sp. 65-26]